MEPSRHGLHESDVTQASDPVQENKTVKLLVPQYFRAISDAINSIGMHAIIEAG